MASKKLDEMSNEELLQQQKLIKTVTATLAGMLLALFILAVYVAIKKELYVFIVIPFGLLPIVIMNINMIKKIKKEFNARKDVA